MLLAALSLLAAAMASFALVAIVLVRLPADYLHADHAGDPPADGRRLSFWAAKILRNVLGALLVVLGIVLSIPGVPGQGLLTVLTGLLLIDFPGKHRLLSKALGRPGVLAAINRLRRRFSRPPLEAPWP